MSTSRASYLWLAAATLIAIILMWIVVASGPAQASPPFTPEAAKVRVTVDYWNLKGDLFAHVEGFPWYPAPPPEKIPVTRHPRRSAGNVNGGVTFSGSVEQWRSLVSKYFRPGDVNTALRIIRCESRGDPNAKNSRSSASGLWQHLRKYWGTQSDGRPGRAEKAGIPGASIWDPEASTIVAAWLRYEAGGWGHWTCY